MKGFGSQQAGSEGKDTDAKPDDQGLVPETYMMERERTDSEKFIPELPPTYVQTHEISKCNLNPHTCRHTKQVNVI